MKVDVDKGDIMLPSLKLYVVAKHFFVEVDQIDLIRDNILILYDMLLNNENFNLKMKSNYLEFYRRRFVSYRRRRNRKMITTCSFPKFENRTKCNLIFFMNLDNILRT